MTYAHKVDLNQSELWQCAQCGKQAKATAHQVRQKYCSIGCMAIAYSERLKGGANPNFRDANKRTCERCGNEYRSYEKDRKFCSHACYAQSTSARAPLRKQTVLRLVKPSPVKKPRVSKLIEAACRNCGALFKYRRRADFGDRIYCSYPCFVKDGGPFRAGLAARMATMKYGAKKDANHKEIMDVLNRFCAVYDLSNAGCGIPDGCAWVKNEWHFFDIKNPKTSYGRRGLNTVQKKWLFQHQGGPVYLIYSIEEAFRFSRGDFDGIKFEKSGYMMGNIKRASVEVAC